MTTPIGDNLRAWKNAATRTSPIVTLYEIEVSDSEIVRLVEGDPTGEGSITYGGETYLAAAMAREDVEQNIEGDLRSFKLAISNVDGVAGGYIENYDLDDRTVTIRRMALSTLRGS